MKNLMKRISILISIIAACRALSYAGIATSGGVTASSFTLTTNPVLGYVLTCDGSGNGTWQQSGTILLNSTNTWTAPNAWASSATFKNGSFSVGGSTFVITGGQVAIGTTTPSNALSVESGNIDASGYIQAGGPNGGAVLFTGAAVNGGTSGGGLSFVGRPRIGDWGKWLQLGEPNGTNNGVILQITNAGIFTGASTGLTDNPTIRSTLDDGTGSAYISNNLTVNSSATFSNNVQVSGRVTASSFTMTSGAGSGYFLLSDAAGNASWQSRAVLFNSTNTWTAPNTWLSSATIQGVSAPGGYSLSLSSGINMPSGTVNAGLFVGNGAGLTGVTSRGDSDYAVIQEQQPEGTLGGTFTAGAWQVRALNTTVSVAGGDVSTASLPSITLSSGTWRVQGFAHGFRCAVNQTRFQNTTDGTTAIIGQSVYAQTTGTATNSNSMLLGTFTISSSKTFQLQHRCSNTEASDGFGFTAAKAPAWGENEVYSEVIIQRIK